MDRQGSRQERRQYLRYEVVRLKVKGHSLRAIARALGVHRDTVKGLLAEQERLREEGGDSLERELGPPQLARASQLDPFDEQIRAWLDEFPELRADRCLEMLRERGFRGGYTIVRERVRALKLAKRQPKIAPEIEHPPGQRAEFDWSPFELGSGGRAIELWGAILCWSRAPAVRARSHRRQSDILECLIESFEQWGGVPQECMTDSMKGVVDRWEADQPMLNARFVDFAAHYQFEVVIAPRACPKHKARVERRFRDIGDNLFNGRHLSTLDQVSHHASAWQHSVLLRAHPRLRPQTIGELLSQERPHLLPLPGKPYDARDIVSRVVNGYGRVAYQTNEYPACGASPGQIVYLAIDRQQVLICNLRAKKLVEHPRLPEGAAIRLAHPQAPRRGRFDLELLTERVVEWAGEAGAAFAAGLRHRLRYPGPALERLLLLQGDWSRDDLVAAMRHALEYGCYQVGAIERILQARFRPRRLPERIADASRQQVQQLLADHPVGLRPITSYDYLREGDPGPASNDEQEP